MTTFFWILLSTFLISLIAFGGVIILFLKDRILNKILLVLVSFASGVLLSTAFLHLLPEAIKEVGDGEEAVFKIFLFLLLGFGTFYVLENFIGWHHHHAKEHPEIHHSAFCQSSKDYDQRAGNNCEQYPRGGRAKPFAYLILISDSIHNFIDGLIVAASFLTSLPIGLATAIAVALHEIPQEIGDFGILVYGGVKKIKALLLNFLSASTIILGGLFGYFLSEKIGKEILFLLPFAAGSFIYISASDLIPQIKEIKGFKKSVIYFLAFLTGIIILALMKVYSGEPH